MDSRYTPGRYRAVYQMLSFKLFQLLESGQHNVLARFLDFSSEENLVENSVNLRWMHLMVG